MIRSRVNPETRGISRLSSRGVGITSVTAPISEQIIDSKGLMKKRQPKKEAIIKARKPSMVLSPGIGVLVLPYKVPIIIAKGSPRVRTAIAAEAIFEGKSINEKAIPKAKYMGASTNSDASISMVFARVNQDINGIFLPRYLHISDTK
jgi:hypothetical protein